MPAQFNSGRHTEVLLICDETTCKVSSLYCCSTMLPGISLSYSGWCNFSHWPTCSLLIVRRGKWVGTTYPILDQKPWFNQLGCGHKKIKVTKETVTWTAQTVNVIYNKILKSSCAGKDGRQCYGATSTVYLPPNVLKHNTTSQGWSVLPSEAQMISKNWIFAISFILPQLFIQPVFKT